MKERKWMWLIMITAVLLVASGSTASVYADEVWQATYWNNTTLSGAPVLQRPELVLDSDWGTASPASGIVNKDYFSVRWERTVPLSGGRYRFFVLADDGVRVWVDDVLIIDGWQNQPLTPYIGYAEVSGGSAEVRVEYYDNQHHATIRLTWTKVGGSGPLPGEPADPASDNQQPADGGGDESEKSAVVTWTGEYFNNAYLIGSPVLTRSDAAIDFDWGLDPPDRHFSVFQNERFSVRWTQTANLPAGQYTFTVTVDDGVRLWVDDQLIIDQWGTHAGATFTATADLPGGSTPMQVDYYDDVGLAEIHLSWQRINGSGGIPQPE